MIHEMLDTRIRSSDGFARVTGLPVMAEFPKVREGTRRLAESFARTGKQYGYGYGYGYDYGAGYGDEPETSNTPVPAGNR